MDTRAPSPPGESPPDRTKRAAGDAVEKAPEEPAKKSHRRLARPSYDRIALLLQGGGALGAYQAGVYEALAEADLQPGWVSGISIGGINAAIIAGNPPESRVARLREFWETITANPWICEGALGPLIARGDVGRRLFNQISAGAALASGAPGFFDPWKGPPWFHPAGTLEAASYYRTSALKETLERLVDFDRINSDAIRFSVGAVNVRTGNFVYFNTAEHTIRAQHVMASGALPPGFPAVEIEGEYYWDGGLVSNTPLLWLLERGLLEDTLAFQIDLWNARGELPRDIVDVGTRQKEIQYSSRTRAATDTFKFATRFHSALADLMDKLPPEIRKTPEAERLAASANRHVCKIVHLIYRSRNYEGYAKDYAFSRLAMNEHWRAGYNDAVRTLREPAALERPSGTDVVATFDLGADGRD